MKRKKTKKQKQIEKEKERKLFTVKTWPPNVFLVPHRMH